MRQGLDTVKSLQEHEICPAGQQKFATVLVRVSVLEGVVRCWAVLRCAVFSMVCLVVCVVVDVGAPGAWKTFTIRAP